MLSCIAEGNIVLASGLIGCPHLLHKKVGESTEHKEVVTKLLFYKSLSLKTY